MNAKRFTERPSRARKGGPKLPSGVPISMDDALRRERFECVQPERGHGRDGRGEGGPLSIWPKILAHPHEPRADTV